MRVGVLQVAASAELSFAGVERALAVECVGLHGSSSRGGWLPRATSTARRLRCDASAAGGCAAAVRGALRRTASVASALGALLVVVGLRGDVERLGALGAVAVDGDGLEALAPALHVGLGDVVDGSSRAAG